MTSESTQGHLLHAIPLSPTASSEGPAIPTPLSTSPSDHSSEQARRRPSPNHLEAQAARGEGLHAADDAAQPSTALLADAGDRRSLSDDENDDARGRKECPSDEDAKGEASDMAASTPRPPMHRPTGGRSEVPLLKDERGRPQYESPDGSARPAFAARRSTFRSRSPDFDAKSATRKKYIYASFFLGVSLVSFVVQTETAAYIQKKLHWEKAYCML